MSILVTGGAGFIGSFVVEKLAEKGFNVIVYDNFTTGSRENIKNALEKGNVKIIEGDVRDYNKLLEVTLKTEKIVHLAALISIEESIKKPELYLDVNVKGTLNVLKAASSAKARKVIYISSAAVYGEPIRLPISEDHPLRPISPYGATKASAEALCHSYHKAHGLPVAILRPFNVYGPRQQLNPYSGVITKFIEALLRDEEPIIYGDGEQTRDFIYVEDVAEAITLALEKEGIEGEAINIATGQPTTINSLLAIIAKTMNKQPKAHTHHQDKET